MNLENMTVEEMLELHKKGKDIVLNDGKVIGFQDEENQNGKL